jgi:hypothetical protein
MSRFSLPETKDDPPPVDPDALREFAAGAKDHRTDQPPTPWESLDPAAPPKHNVSVRLNDYQHEMLRFLAARADVSQQKILNRILIPALVQQAKQIAGASQVP